MRRCSGYNGWWCSLHAGHTGACPLRPRWWRHPIWWLKQWHR